MLSPALVTLASPLASAVSSASGAVLRGAEGAFDKLLHLGENALSSDGAQATRSDAPSAKADSSESTGRLQTRFDLLTAQFQKEALLRLDEAGIALRETLTLEADALGNLRVADGHPQAAWIEGALAADPGLAKLFTKLQSVHRELVQSERASEIEQLYALNPNAARRDPRDRSLLEETPLRVSLTPPPARVGMI